MQEAQHRDAVLGPEGLVHGDAVDLGAVGLAEVEGDDETRWPARASSRASSACCTSAPPTIGRAGSRDSTGQG